MVAVCLTGEDGWLHDADVDVQRQAPGARGAFCATTPDVLDATELHALARAAAAVSCGPLRSARSLSSRVAVAHAADAVVHAPTRHDPTVELLRHDDARGTDLARTLLTWLDLHGDVPAAARRLDVHVNTLRYRLSRAGALLTCDLDDPAARLDVHLRLRRALGG